MDALLETEMAQVPRGNARRPLLGLTILLVEDSRYCSEAVRLLCLSSGARLRRADSQRAAYRHLATYRPSLVIVDIGLPDGDGLDMVRELSAHRPNAPVILATSGDDPAFCESAAIAAGADGFMPKPLKNIKTFQQDILHLFPGRERFNGHNVLPMKPEVEPDALAIVEDLRHARDLIQSAVTRQEEETLTYCAQFMWSVAEATGLPDLRAIADDLQDSVKAHLFDAAAFARPLTALDGRIAKAALL